MADCEGANNSQNIVLLPSKITIPSRMPSVLGRPSLMTKLARSVSCSLTSVISSAGFGKTTAVLSWLDGLAGVPAAWYLLDSEDAALDRFLIYLTTALRNADELICQSLGDTRLSGKFEELLPVLDILVLQMAEYGKDFVCVLEDFHVVQEDEDIHKSVFYLLKYMPNNAHFIITSRQPLRFPTQKMKVEGTLNEITETDLRLTQEEAVELCARAGIRLNKEQLASIYETTSGWATGIRLITLLCGDGSQEQINEALMRAQQSINDYLLEEVFSVLPDKRKQFLVMTAITESFCIPLAECITEFSREEVVQHIDYLLDNGLFIEKFERKGGEDWYRYHLLLADLLHERLDRADEIKKEALGALACDWLEARGYLDSAVELAASLRDFERIRSIILNNWMSLYMSDSHYTPLRWAAFLPEAEIMASPFLCAVLSMPFALRGEFEKASICLKNAIEHLHDGEDFLFALCLVQKAFIASFKNESDNMRAFAEKALLYLPEDEFYLRSMMLQVKAASCIGEDPLGGKAAFVEALHMQLKYNNKGLSSSVFCNLSLICANLGHIKEAHHYSEQALLLYAEHERRFKPMLSYAYLAEMICAYERNDLEGSQKNYECFRETAAKGAVPTSEVEASTLDAKVRYQSGTLGAEEYFFTAFSANREGSLSAYPSFRMALDYSRTFKSISFELGGSPFEKNSTGLFNAMLAYHLDMIARYEEVCALSDFINEEERSLYVRSALVACAFSEKVARPARADEYFERAVRHAMLHGLRGALLENASYVENSLRRFLSQTDDANLTSEVRHIFEASPGAPETMRLTEREIDVMRCIAAGASVARAADELFVSRETVKKHLSNIYAKLGVHSKMQAVALLRDDGVI